MKTRFRLIQRRNRGGRFYCVDKKTGRRESLETHDPAEARRLVEARNTAEQQRALNFQLARAYLLSSVPGITTRTWSEALVALIEAKHGATRERWERAASDRALDRIRNRPLIDTHSEDFLAVLKKGTVSTNVHLRKLHNFVLDMNWLPVPVLPKRQWPKIRFGAKRAIALAEHQAVLGAVFQQEQKAYAKNAVALCPALEEYERVSAGKVVAVGFAQAGTAAVSAV
jgi:hypothetical protein